MISYPIGNSAQVLQFDDKVIMHFRRYRQLRWWHREAGGQLFARLVGTHVRIVEATGPRSTDRRSRWSYIPDRRAEQNEIALFRKSDLHYVGDWHSHPEPVPNPSERDILSIADAVNKSTHNLNGFVLVVVGQLELPAGLNVFIHDGAQLHQLTLKS